MNGHYGPITHNFRPIQPLNERIVYENVPLSEPDTIDVEKPPILPVNVNDIDDEDNEATVPGSIGDIEPVFKEFRKENSAPTTRIGKLFLASILLTIRLL